MNVRWIWSLCILAGVAACAPKYAVPSDGTAETQPESPAGPELFLPNVRDYPDLEMREEATMLSSKELANKICYCAYEMNQMNEDIKRHHSNNDRASLVRNKGNVQRVYQKFDRCMAEIKAHYPKSVAGNDPEEVMREVEKECPVLPQLLEAGSRNLQKKQ